MTQEYCQGCGTALEAAAKFCPQCGTAVSGSSTKSQSKSTTGVSSRDMLVVVGVLAAMTTAFFIFKSPGEKPEPPRPQAQQNDQMPGGHEGMLPPEVLETLPKDYANLVNLGNTYMDQSNLVMAAEIYSRALAIDGSSGNVRTDYGACLHGMGLPVRALEEFRKVIAAEPTHAIAHFNMGIVFRGVAELDSARVYWTKYLEMDPSGGPAPEARRMLQEIGG